MKVLLLPPAAPCTCTAPLLRLTSSPQSFKKGVILRPGLTAWRVANAAHPFWACATKSRRGKDKNPPATAAADGKQEEEGEKENGGEAAAAELRALGVLDLGVPRDAQVRSLRPTLPPHTRSGARPAHPLLTLN